MTARFLVLTGWLLLVVSVDAQTADPPKRIYIANDDHTDYLWSADEETYARVFVDLLDFHLRLADETASNPAPYRNRFNCDGSFWLWTYERRKSPAEWARLIERVRDGTISVPYNTLVSCYGAQPAEAVLRGLYYAGRLERRYGLRFSLATAMENQTLPLGLTSLFAGAGARYSWRGVCGCATKLDHKGLGARDHEIYWWTGKDGRRLLMKWYSQVGAFGGYWEAGSPADAVRFADTDAGFLRRNADPVTKQPYNVVGIFGFGGDDLERKTGVPPPPTIPAVPGLQKVVSSPYSDHFHVVAKQESNAQRQVIVSNEEDFFADFLKTHGASLPGEAVTHGNEWDLYSASMSETSARVKRAVEKLRAAELLAALVSQHYPEFMKRHAVSRDLAFTDLGLYWEHDWTADGAISRAQRAAWQERLAAEIEFYVQSIHGEAAIRLGGMIPRPEKAERFFVLNPLGWMRTGPVDLPNYKGGSDIHVRDLATGQDVPHQIVKIDGTRSLRILAADVPSAGYKVFEVQPGLGSAPTDAAATVGGAGDSVFENETVRLVVERNGAIRSFVDKRRSGTEFAAVVGDAKINCLSDGSGGSGEPLRVENRGPVSVTIRARSEAGLPHTSDITLYRGSDRVDIANQIDANFSDVRHWAFGFALTDPVVHTEEVGAVLLDKLRSAGGDYADASARYDYLTVNHFADLSDGSDKKGVTLSSPDLAFGKLGSSTANKLDTSTPQIQMLAGGQVDGSGLGIAAQNGQRHFLQCFALQPHGAYSQTAAMRFALEHQNPLVAAPVISKGAGPYPETSYSLIGISDPDVLLWALKIHDDGPEHGLVARVWNQADAPRPLRFTTAAPLAGAQRLTHVETPVETLPLKGGALETTVGAQRMETYGLKFATP